MMSMIHSQNDRAISSAITERVIPFQGTGTLSPVCRRIGRRLENTQMGSNRKLQKRTAGLLLI